MPDPGSPARTRHGTGPGGREAWAPAPRVARNQPRALERAADPRRDLLHQSAQFNRTRGRDGHKSQATLAVPTVDAIEQCTLGVIGFVMQNLNANPLDLNIDDVRVKRERVSEWLDTTYPDLSEFRERGGKLIVAVGTDDTTAPSGEQLNYYQSILDTMGRDAVDSFVRPCVLPQTGHGLSGRSAAIDGEGNVTDQAAIPPTPPHMRARCRH